MAAMAGMMALSALPMIASVLAGLTDSSGSVRRGGTQDGGRDESGGADGALSPEAQKALRVLELLAKVYGDGDTKDPEVKMAREKLRAASGFGDTATAVRAKRLYQANAAAAFNNLDNQLASYLVGMAGSHKVDKKAIKALLREVNIALAGLGQQAYTKAGQQKVRDILTAALKKAQRIVADGQVNATNTAATVDRLTNQYLDNIHGRSAPAGSVKGTSSVAQKAVEVALAQLGDPYVWAAEGPNTFDCSGLMQYAAAKAGIKIPRVARDQYQQLPKVHSPDVRPGDLIFPDAQFNGGRPGHVMMYIGNGKCIHAPQPGDVVRITSLPKSYHASRFT